MEKSLSKEEKKFISLLKEREELSFQVKISEEAIDFWEGQMKVVFNDIDENDENSWHPNYQHKAEELQDKIRSLMARGKIETRTIDKIEQKCNELDEKVTDFVKDIKELEKVKEIVKKHIKKKN
jgi:gas vesicle protein